MHKQSGILIFLAGLGLSLLSASLLWLAFPPLEQGWVAWVAFVPLAVAHSVLASRAWQARLFQALFYSAFTAAVVLPSFPLDLLPGFPAAALIAAAILIVGAAIYPLAIPAGTPGFHRKTGYRFFVLYSAVCWTGLEYVRYRLELGHIWGILPITQHANLPLLQIATVGGMWAISFLVVAANYAIGLGLVYLLLPLEKKPDRRLVGLSIVVTAALVLLAHVLGLAVLRHPSSTLRVAALQAGIDTGGDPLVVAAWSRRDWPAMSHAVVDILEPLTRQAAEQGAEFIVWPEAAVWLDPQSEPTIEERLSDLARETDAYLLVTYFILPDEGVLSWYLGFAPGMRNEAVLISPQGEFLGINAKDHPIRYIGETGPACL